ncbi:MAG: 50S ribosomal protein L15 [bacterium]|nr:50S ribosomal protein L15 [bacterium]
MTLTELSGKIPKKSRKRVGRGNGSGHGTYACKGTGGQTKRSGGRRRPGFEGGQTPYLRRMPKLKGFRNPNQIDYQIVNVGDLNIFDSKNKVDAEALHAKNLISKRNKPVKLLASKGVLEKTLTIVVDKASKAAIAAVEAKKGKVEFHQAQTSKKEKASE